MLSKKMEYGTHSQPELISMKTKKKLKPEQLPDQFLLEYNNQKYLINKRSYHNDDPIYFDFICRYKTCIFGSYSNNPKIFMLNGFYPRGNPTTKKDENKFKPEEYLEMIIKFAKWLGAKKITLIDASHISECPMVSRSSFGFLRDGVSFYQKIGFEYINNKNIFDKFRSKYKSVTFCDVIAEISPRYKTIIEKFMKKYKLNRKDKLHLFLKDSKLECKELEYVVRYGFEALLTAIKYTNTGDFTFGNMEMKL